MVCMGVGVTGEPNREGEFGAREGVGALEKNMFLGENILKIPGLDGFKLHSFHWII
jgi:hypothetical protein